jgi:uncharacterized alpha-E superfamily protein
MLSRTADHLFWMARYTERAENTARMLDANYQMSLLPQSDEFAEAGWRAMLAISELSQSYASRHTGMESNTVIDFMTRDRDNLSSIVNCLRAARENARAARGAITTDLWETINTTWLDCQRLLAEGALERDPRGFFEWVKFRSNLSRGIQHGTMVRDKAFDFIRLGMFLERADNTARILDVKFSMLQQKTASTEALDYYHWATVLRSVTGLEAYRKVYRDVYTPAHVAELLILYRDWPRSLAACMNEINLLLGRLRIPGSVDTERFAEQLWGELRDGRIDDILRGGLHAYLTQFLACVNKLASHVSRDFLVPIAEEEAPAQ